MAVTHEAVFSQYPRTCRALCTAAKTTYNDIANAVQLMVAGPNGAELTLLGAVPRATVTSTQLQLYLSRDWGATFEEVTTEVMNAVTVSQTAQVPPTRFYQNGAYISDSNTFRVGGDLGGLASTFAGVSRGAANAQTLSPYPAIASNAAGTVLDFFAGYTNTGATTLAVSGLTALPVVRDDTGAPLSQGDIMAGCRHAVLGDGTNWRLIRADRLYVAIGVALAGGIQFTGNYRDF